MSRDADLIFEVQTGFYLAGVVEPVALLVVLLPDGAGLGHGFHQPFAVIISRSDRERPEGARDHDSRLFAAALRGLPAQPRSHVATRHRSAATSETKSRISTAKPSKARAGSLVVGVAEDHRNLVDVVVLGHAVHVPLNDLQQTPREA